ncbi:peptidoglycan-binding protein [Streptomyces platensis]|uniref:peptidoglycan-binding protein n=1 Tax=Streptomyces platensis TaxID=58346 RepID=UPI001F3D1CB7|nr:peptidoglycan-binding protein [Streptomyces platensis]MCF3146769.1 peptidoglycan-binding protein [Streptomyces platensis]
MTGPTAPDRDAVRALAELLRTWWELSAREGRPKPTQQSLAGRLGIDQTTLSRYLNPRHPSTAPLRTVELLHTVLRAPAADLPRARALAEAAAAGAARRSPRPADAAPSDGPVASSSHLTAPPPTPVPAARVTRRTAAARAALALLGVLTLGGGIGLGWGALAHRAGPDGPPVAAVAASAGSTAAGWPLARKGDLLCKARAVQYLLRAHGHDVEADGDFGVRTAAAVKKFQAAHGLLADGKVGVRTWSHLIIRIDSRHAPRQAVVALQYLLDNSGTATDITGLFTPSTTRSLETFQRDRALPVTGVADRDTWRVLLSAQGPGVHR